jgi:F-type H+-transporting ATPase subunit b
MGANPFRRWLPALAAGALTALPALASEPAHGGGEPNLFAGNIGNAVWTLVIFGAVLFVLGKYAWGPIINGLKQREDFIRDSLTKAKADREAAEAQLKAYEERLTTARSEATKIVEEGRRDAEVVKGRIEQQARQEAEKIIERAKREIDIAKDTAIKELYARAGALATDAASRIIRHELSGTDHQRLIAEAIARLESAGPGSFGSH